MARRANDLRLKIMDDLISEMVSEAVTQAKTSSSAPLVNASTSLESLEPVDPPSSWSQRWAEPSHRSVGTWAITLPQPRRSRFWNHRMGPPPTLVWRHLEPRSIDPLPVAAVETPPRRACHLRPQSPERRRSGSAQAPRVRTPATIGSWPGGPNLMASTVESPVQEINGLASG